MNTKKIVIGNWKMKLTYAQSIALAKDYVKKIKIDDIGPRDVVACAPDIALAQISKIFKHSEIKLGAQNVFWEEQGAYTGEVSAPMLEEVGCHYTIVGHSERRQYLLENYQLIHQKVKAVLTSSKLTPIVCIGESLQERDSGRRDYVITDQLQQAIGGIHFIGGQQLVVAYEPIWAIGTGQPIQPEDAANMHKIISVALIDLFGVDVLKNYIRVVYGGSVTSKNAADFTQIENVDGLLIGSASLDADEFREIIQSV